MAAAPRGGEFKPSASGLAHELSGVSVNRLRGAERSKTFYWWISSNARAPPMP